MELYRKALETFIHPFKQDHNVIGILLSGSYVHAKPDKNSDLDVYIIEKENTFRERGNTWIDGFEIEYFINPVKQVRHYFKTEAGISPHTAHMLVHCEVLYQNGNLLDELREEALELLNKCRPNPDENQRELLKYGLDDIWKDIEDVYLKSDDFAFALLGNRLVEYCIDTLGKIMGFYPDKAKRLEPQLREINPGLTNLLKAFLLSSEKKRKFEVLRNMKIKMEELLGGARAKEWLLKTECTFG